MVGVVLFLGVHLTIGGGLSGAYPDFSPVPHGLAALAALGASALLFVRAAPPERSTEGLARAWRWPRRERAGEGAASPSWTVAAGRIAWLTYRQARGVWPALAVLGLGLPIWAVLGFGYSWHNPEEPVGLAVLANGLVAILAGVWVFGSEQSGRTYRLLAHHGVRPALAWGVKTGVWLAALALLWLPLALGFANRFSRVRADETGWAVLAVVLGVTVFAVAVLCGMVFRRPITGALLAFVVVLPILLGIMGLLGAGLMEWWWVAVPPAALLTVAWAWAGPWMLDRPGASRWARLAALLGGASATVFALYAGGRAWGLPAPAPLPAPLAASLADASDPIPDAENAAPLYREAWQAYLGGASKTVGQRIEAGAPPNDLPPGAMPGTVVLNIPSEAIRRALLRGWPAEDEAPLSDFLERQAKALDLSRAASARPRCLFQPLDRMDLFAQREAHLGGQGGLAELVGLSAEERRARGDLEGAWDDLAVLFRMARHQSGAVPLVDALSGLSVERQALGQAMRWAADPKQTPERLHAALASYRSLPALHPLEQSWAAEEAIARQTLELPADSFRDNLAQLGSRDRPSTALLARLVSTPWERERARRALRVDLLHTLSTQRVSGDIRRPPPRDPRGDARVQNAQRTTPLARLFGSAFASTAASENQNEVGRRALVQILALRAWQVSHDGRLPEKLEDLVPSELDHLPNDPFGGPTQPFGYVQITARRLPVLGSLPPYPPTPPWPNYPGQPAILYSGGLDGTTRMTSQAFFAASDDLIFPLADQPPEPVVEEPSPRLEPSDRP